MSLTVLQFADVENAYDDPEHIGRLAGLIAELRDAETVVCGSGDDTGPGVLSVVTEGTQSLDFLEAVGVDAETFGNHDFDFGPEPLRRVVADSSFPWLAANAHEDGDLFARDDGVRPWTVVEASDHRVGLVGVANPETSDINPFAEPVEFTDPIPAVRDAVAALREEGVTHVVVLSHLGDDADLARAVDVDAVLGGHDHERTVEYVDGTLVARPGGNGRFLLEVEFDGRGDSADDDDRPTATHHPVSEAPLDESVADALRDRMEATGLTEVVGHADDPVVCDMQASKAGESRLGNLVTDAFRWRSGADVAVYFAGAFRRRPPLEGDVTAFDLVGVNPFPRSLYCVELAGADLLATFTHVAAEPFPDAPDWFFGHVSGAELVWDDAADELLEARVGRDPVDPAATYTVATSEFCVVNVELFPAFGPDDVVDEFGLGYEAIVDYVREVGIDPVIEGRIRRPTLPDDAVPERDWPFTPRGFDGR